VRASRAEKALQRRGRPEEEESRLPLLPSSTTTPPRSPNRAMWNDHRVAPPFPRDINLSRHLTRNLGGSTHPLLDTFFRSIPEPERPVELQLHRPAAIGVRLAKIRLDRQRPPPRANYLWAVPPRFSVICAQRFFYGRSPCHLNVHIDDDGRRCGPNFRSESSAPPTWPGTWPSCNNYGRDVSQLL